MVIMTAKKSYEIKDWFANKIANEVGRNINMCEVFAVLKETEKAVYAMLNLGCNFRKCMWIPKSVLVENEVGEDENSTFHYETLFISDYNEAVEAFKAFWKNFI